MVGTAIKYREEEEEEEGEGEGELVSENMYTSKRALQRIGADDEGDEDEELRKRRKNCPMMVGQQRFWGKPEVE